MSRVALLKLNWEGVDGSVWHIRTTGPVARGVMLDAPSGLVSNPSRSTSANSTGRGVRVGGYSFPEMEGTLALRVFADTPAGMTLGEVYDGLLASLSTIEEGRLVVVDGRGLEWSSDQVLMTKEPAPPATSPHAFGLRDVQVDVPLTVLDGVMSRHTTWGDTTTAGVVTVANRGNLPAYPVLRWDGETRQVVTPRGVTVDLPKAAGWRRLSTDPGTGYVITDDAGNVDVDAWSSMRGLAVPGEIMPRATADWTLPAGVELLLDEYRTNVWR